MKKLLLLLVITMGAHFVWAQETSEAPSEGFFKKEQLFVGGTLNAQFGNLSTALGISPYVGYNFGKFLDLAVSPGINYVSQRDYPYYGDRIRQTTYGPGAFVRMFPIKSVFIIGQYEFNFLNTKYIPYGATGSAVEKYKYDAHSFLLGGGYASGRDFKYQKSYYYFSIMWDMGHAPHSPYKDNLDRAVPIIRAGYNIALFQGRYY